MENFPLNNNTKGLQSTEPTTEAVKFENDESYVPMFASYKGSKNLLATNSSFEEGNINGWTLDRWGTVGDTRVVYDGTNGRHCVEFYASPTPTATPTATSTDAIIYQDCILDSALTVQTDFMLSAMTKTYGRKGKDLNALSSTAIDNIFKAGRNSTINKQYDLLGRITTRKITTGSYAGTGYNANYETRYSYIDKTGGASTYLLESLTNKDKTITYTYDADGNIESIIQPVNGVNI